MTALTFAIAALCIVALAVLGMTQAPEPDDGYVDGSRGTAAD